MNLKLDDQSVRIRISYQEAKALLDTKVIEQDLSLFSGRLKINLVSDQSAIPLYLELQAPGEVKVKVASHEILKILNAMDAGERKSENLEVSTVYRGVGTNSKPIHVSFEVDRFKGPRH